MTDYNFIDSDLPEDSDEEKITELEKDKIKGMKTLAEEDQSQFLVDGADESSMGIPKHGPPSSDPYDRIKLEDCPEIRPLTVQRRIEAKEETNRTNTDKVGQDNSSNDSTGLISTVGKLYEAFNPL